MQNKKRFFLQFIVSFGIFSIAASGWFLFPELYFRIKYNEYYRDKGIFAIKRNIDPRLILEEISLQSFREKKSLAISIPLESFNKTKNADVVISQDGLKLIRRNANKQSYTQADILLDKKQMSLINSLNYSLSFSVFCESNTAKTTYVNIILNNKEFNSPMNLYPRGILTVVVPQNRLKTDKISIKLVNNTSTPAIFKSPKIIFTPFYPNLINRNFREEFNFQKGVKTRIMAIGGSTTYGTGSANNCAWPSILQQKLEYLYPDRFEVINLGTWGGGIRDFIESYDNILWQRLEKNEYEANPDFVKTVKKYTFGYKDLKPDIVLLCVSWNDFTYALVNLHLKKPFLLGKSFYEIESVLRKRLCKTTPGFFVYRGIYRIMSLMVPKPNYINIEELISMMNNPDMLNLDYPSLFKTDATIVESISRDFSKNLSELIAIFKKQNIDVRLVILPSLVYSKQNDYTRIKKFGWSDNFFKIQYWSFGIGGLIERKIIKDIAKINNIEVYDLSFIFSGEKAQTRNEIFCDLIHLTSKGNDYVASELLNSLNLSRKEQ